MKYSRIILTAAAASVTLAQQVAKPIVQQPPQYAYNQQAGGAPQQQMRADPDSPTINHQAPPQQQQQQQQQPQYVINAAPQGVQIESVKPVAQQPVMPQAIGRPPAPERQQVQPPPNVQEVPNSVPSANNPVQQNAPVQQGNPVQQGAPQYQQQAVPGVQYQAANPSQIYAGQQAAVPQPGVVHQQAMASEIMQGAQKPVIMNQAPGQAEPVKVAPAAANYVGQVNAPSINDQAILAQQMAAARQQQALYGNAPPVMVAGQQQQQPIYVNQGVPVHQQYNAGGAMQYDHHPYANIYNNAPKVVGVKPANNIIQPPTLIDAAAAAPQVPAAESEPASSIAADWDKHMQNFMPQMILTFRLNGGEAEHFHQDVTVPGTLIRGGYFESTTEGAPGSLSNAAKGGSRRHVGFKILSPSGKLLFSSDKTESLFRVDCSEVGTYTFAVSSASWSKSKFVTFVMGTGEVSPLTGSDISSIDGNIKMLYRMLSEIETHNNLLWTRHRAQAEQIRKTSNKTYYAFIIELLCTAAAIIAQLATVKKMISKRSMF